MLRNGTSEPALPADGNSGAVRETLDIITSSRKSRDAAAQELTLLREERRRINDALAAEGGAARKIQALEKTISRAREDLTALYRRTGGEVEAGAESAERYAHLLEAAENDALEQIHQLRDGVHLNEQRIGRLETAIAIDETNADIAKMEASVEEHRRRIKESENAAANLERLIARARERVETRSRELSKPPPGAEDPAEGAVPRDAAP